jgi:hypothetical protein
MSPSQFFVVLTVCLWLPSALGAGGSIGPDGKRTSRISLEAVTHFDFENFPKRPKPILELGDDFLGPGNIGKGLELPTGAVWQPSLVVFGTYRTALQTYRANDVTTSEWANRLDLFANLQLSGSERFLLGIRPLDEDGQFTSHQFRPDGPGDEDGYVEAINAQITTFFFEGDLGEIFPNLDRNDQKRLDLGFAVGRQPVNYQEGMLINDSIDAIGITRNTLLPKGGSDLQVTFLFGWNDVHRDDNLERDNTKLWSLSFALDGPKSTNNLDLVYIDDPDGETDGFFWGVSDVRRIGHFNLSTRILGSHATEDESDVVSDGNLIFAELSWSPAWTQDHVYTNFFVGIDEFASAARGPPTGGPLGRTGILFQAVGLGRYGAPLGNRADKSYGGAFGYQWFIDPVVNQFIFEIGARQQTADDRDAALSVGMRYRHVFGSHIVMQADAFGTLNNSRDNDYGLRLEMRTEF